MISDAKEFIYFDDCVDFTFVSDPDPIPIILFVFVVPVRVDHNRFA